MPHITPGTKGYVENEDHVPNPADQIDTVDTRWGGGDVSQATPDLFEDVHSGRSQELKPGHEPTQVVVEYDDPLQNEADGLGELGPQDPRAVTTDLLGGNATGDYYLDRTAEAAMRFDPADEVRVDGETLAARSVPAVPEEASVQGDEDVDLTVGRKVKPPEDAPSPAPLIDPPSGVKHYGTVSASAVVPESNYGSGITDEEAQDLASAQEYEESGDAPSEPAVGGQAIPGEEHGSAFVEGSEGDGASDDLESLNVEQLHERASAADIAGRSNMNRAELIEALRGQ